MEYTSLSGPGGFVDEKDQPRVQKYAVESHTGRWCDFLFRHEKELLQLHCDDSMWQCERALFRRMTDERALFFGFTATDRKLPKYREEYNQLADSDDEKLSIWWYTARSLRDDLRKGRYTPEKPREISIPKSNGGYRRIHEFSYGDAAVQRACLAVLHPLFDPTLTNVCHGGRTGFGLWSVRKQLIDAYEESASPYLIIEDLKGAFDYVPIGRLIQIVKMRLKNDEAINLLKVILAGQPRKRKTRGISQGSVLSPLLLNIYVAHLIDRKIFKGDEVVTAVRYIDDLAVLCMDRRTQTSTYRRLAAAIKNAGFRPKHGRRLACHDLRSRKATWLGQDLSIENGELKFRVREESWEDFDRNLPGYLERLRPGQTPWGRVKGWINGVLANTEGLTIPLRMRLMGILEKHHIDIAKTDVERWIDAAKERWGTYLSAPPDGRYKSFARNALGWTEWRYGCDEYQKELEEEEASRAQFPEKCSAFLDFENGETVLDNHSGAVEPLNQEGM